MLPLQSRFLLLQLLLLLWLLLLGLLCSLLLLHLVLVPDTFLVCVFSKVILVSAAAVAPPSICCYVYFSIMQCIFVRAHVCRLFIFVSHSTLNVTICFSVVLTLCILVLLMLRPRMDEAHLSLLYLSLCVAFICGHQKFYRI